MRHGKVTPEVRLDGADYRVADAIREQVHY